MQEGKTEKENERKDNAWDPATHENSHWEWDPATSGNSRAYNPSYIKAPMWGSRSKGGEVGRL